MHLEEPDLRAIIATTRRQYDENALAYAAKTDDLAYFPGLQAELERFHAALPRGPVLDLGCGAGRDTWHLVSLGTEVVSGDLSVKLLKITGRGQQRNLVQLDLMDLPFRDGAFAGVWVSGGLLHLPSSSHPRAFREIHRVLAVGGVTSISLREGEFEGWRKGERMEEDRWFTLRHPDHVTAEMECAGFDSVTWTHCGRRNWFIVEAIRSGEPTPRDEAQAGSA
ncbi:class I SAM-dependent methyltransferase [Lentzea sp. JNUCC 0626]|uniref:class I SAM-dependent methyltransferase n=1 Tax=Lentzea sp. JNUCC 0626 TaxID=3367513 RepID=UPI003749BE1F